RAPQGAPTLLGAAVAVAAQHFRIELQLLAWRHAGRVRAGEEHHRQALVVGARHRHTAQSLSGQHRLVRFDGEIQDAPGRWTEHLLGELLGLESGTPGAKISGAGAEFRELRAQLGPLTIERGDVGPVAQVEVL
ncbi:MAG: hypothetical protein ACK56I_17350, partial [bacterium]